ncbi:CaiB/BaiF CoA-transferase family protein [Piscinibacter sp. HJYY11]|uniref:CaiB/BaiF CoA transferase family protein n=1 Tax=Piscinibacter sp. HJYY11 TaxID=2801333 RepID=UPI00192017D0|nr:CoA transferase [Piscinibacter sp. HJYY11]MBL0726107.1 CoA transferase [Piscinibacter sp. HJYY11]
MNDAGALAGVRVLDLSRVLAGPLSAQTLGDLGADVIKVERPGVGDDSRHWGPWYWRSDGSTESAWFHCANRNKHSVTADLATAEGQDLVRRLAAEADVLVENYKVGDLARHGLAYEDLRQVNPRLIYCSITGYGQDGPSAHKPGYDFVFQGESGLMSVTGEPDNQLGGGPQKVGAPVVDFVTGLYATVAILAALQARHRTNRGQFVDIALLDCAVAMGINQSASYLMTGMVPRRRGNRHPDVVPYQTFEVADGHITLCVGNDGQWRRLCSAVGRGDLGEMPQYATGGDRALHGDAISDALGAALRLQTVAYWLDTLGAQGIPCGPINDYAQAFASPQARHRGLRQLISTASGEDVPTVASPIRLSDTPVQYRHVAPGLGEHNGSGWKTRG